MPEQHTKQSIEHPQGLAQGTPVIMRSETQVPVSLPQNKDAVFNVTQAGVYLGFIVLLVTAVVSCMKWLDSKLDKLVNKVGEDLKEVRADVKAAEQRILTNEKDVVALDKRLALQEHETRAIKEGQVRIEHTMEKNHKETIEQMKGWAEQFSASIREVRNVAPKP